jgi:hypothetical protein
MTYYCIIKSQTRNTNVKFRTGRKRNIGLKIKIFEPYTQYILPMPVMSNLFPLAGHFGKQLSSSEPQSIKVQK